MLKIRTRGATESQSRNNAMSMRNHLLCQISTPWSGRVINVKYQRIRKFEFMARNATIVSVEVNISIY